jgi:5'-nucleotidase
MEKYVEKDGRLPLLLARLKAANKSLFLLTNSDFAYTNKVMKYILDGDEDWPQKYFDFVVCDANKPSFFGDGSLLRVVDPKTMALKLGVPLDLPKPALKTGNQFKLFIISFCNLSMFTFYFLPYDSALIQYFSKIDTFFWLVSFLLIK